MDLTQSVIVTPSQFDEVLDNFVNMHCEKDSAEKKIITIVYYDGYKHFVVDGNVLMSVEL